MDLCFELASQIMNRLAGAVTVVDEVHGFKYFDERDLLGFVDGTENPAGRAAAAAVLVGDEDPDFAGGSYVIVQKYLHDLAAWNALSVEEQERVIGRTKLADIELPDDVKPPNSHVALNTIVDPDGAERQILRDNMPFGELRRGRVRHVLHRLHAATPASPSRCCATCSSATRPVITTGSSTSPPPSPAACSSCRPRDFLDDLPEPPGAVPTGGPRRRVAARAERFPRHRQPEEEHSR